MVNGSIPQRRALATYAPPVRGKVPPELLVDLDNEGLGGQEIVDVLWVEYGIGFTRAGVSKWRRLNGRGVRERSATKDALIPWVVLREHDQDRLLKFLHVEANSRDGKAPGRARGMYHDAVGRDLAAEKGVVAYTQAGGFRLVTPRPGIDNDCIRDPRFGDDGSPIHDRNLWQ